LPITWIDNPVYKALKNKSRQLRGAPPSVLRCVVLFDAGCSLLRTLRTLGGGREIAGETIIRHALARLRIDVVIVISPYRYRDIFPAARSEVVWKVATFESRESIQRSEYDPKEKLEVLLVRDSGVDGTPHFAYETSADRDAVPTLEYRVNSTLAGPDANEVVSGDPVRTMDLYAERAKFFSGVRENVIDQPMVVRPIHIDVVTFRLHPADIPA